MYQQPLIGQNLRQCGFYNQSAIAGLISATGYNANPGFYKGVVFSSTLNRVMHSQLCEVIYTMEIEGL